MCAGMPRKSDVPCRHPTRLCRFWYAPPAQPVASRHRRAIVRTMHHFDGTATVDLAPLHRLPRLAALALPLPTHALDASQLARLSRLTRLSLCLRRRHRLGLSKPLQCAPLP
jgi:hypothetical protein